MSGKKPKIPLAEKIPFEKITEKMKCRMCHQSKTSNVLHSGDFYKLVVKKKASFYHYFCLLFSSHGVQRGQNEGIEGFLPQDIEKEVKRGESLICYICKKNRATIICSGRGCKKKFHFSCGASYPEDEPEKEHIFIFENESGMKAFCPSHAPKQKRKNKEYQDQCMVCLNGFEADKPAGPLVGRFACPQDFCKAVFHRRCLQNYALSAGQESFACAVCKEKFAVTACRLGIYVPQKPPDWEQEAEEDFYGFNTEHLNFKKCRGSFQEGRCLCPDGDDYNRKGSKWELFACDRCGSDWIHIECGLINIKSPAFHCELCLEDQSEDEEQEEEGNNEESDSEDDETIARIISQMNKEKDKEAGIQRPSSGEEEVEVLDETAPTQSQRDTFGMSKARKQEWEEIKAVLAESPAESDDDAECKIIYRQQGAVPKLSTSWGAPIELLHYSQAPQHKSLSFGHTPPKMKIPLVPLQPKTITRSPSDNPRASTSAMSSPPPSSPAVAPLSESPPPPPSDRGSPPPPPPSASFMLDSPIKYSFSVQTPRIQDRVVSPDLSDDEDPGNLGPVNKKSSAALTQQSCQEEITLGDSSDEDGLDPPPPLASTSACQASVSLTPQPSSSKGLLAPSSGRKRKATEHQREGARERKRSEKIKCSDMARPDMETPNSPVIEEICLDDSSDDETCKIQICNVSSLSSVQPSPKHTKTEPQYENLASEVEIRNQEVADQSSCFSCSICNAEVDRASLLNHLSYQHPDTQPLAAGIIRNKDNKLLNIKEFLGSIYTCQICRTLFTVDDSERPASIINKHFSQKHPGKATKLVPVINLGYMCCHPNCSKIHGSIKGVLGHLNTHGRKNHHLDIMEIPFRDLDKNRELYVKDLFKHVKSCGVRSCSFIFYDDDATRLERAMEKHARIHTESTSPPNPQSSSAINQQSTSTNQHVNSTNQQAAVGSDDEIMVVDVVLADLPPPVPKLWKKS